MCTSLHSSLNSCVDTQGLQKKNVALKYVTWTKEKCSFKICNMDRCTTQWSRRKMLQI